MELIKTTQLADCLKENDWVILYVKAPWCKVCSANEDVMEEVVKETPDIKILGCLATDPENEDTLKATGLESLPYFAVFRKAHGRPHDPISCLVGGASGGGKDVPSHLISQIRKHKDASK